MITLTKEWLLKTIAELEEERDATPGAVNEDATMALAAMKLALASLEAEPVAPVSVPETLPCPVLLEPGMRFGKGVRTQTMLDALQRRSEYFAELEAMTTEQRTERDAGIKEFAAMLQGAENAESRCTIQTAPVLDSSPKNVEPRCGNSPVIPDCWVACSERVPEKADEVLCAKEFDGPGDWRQKVGYYLAGKWTVYSASWTPTHWMPLPAAPQQEVK